MKRKYIYTFTFKKLKSNLDFKFLLQITRVGKIKLYWCKMLDCVLPFYYA